ncbi:MAG TPA: tetratricopeptide repeat protein [Rubrobacteraceae bacterium]|nr:tetratricopeptide repeat protein [Rubrobacteraceae bacterium]
MAGRLDSRASSLLLLGLVCLALVGPLRGVLAPFPALLFLASFALFMIPGALLSGLIRDRGLSGVARVPVAFVFSTGIFGLLGIPLLVLHRSMNEYLVLCGVILAASLVFLAFGAFGRRESTSEDADSPRSFRTLLSIYWPWIPFIVLAGALAYASATRAHGPEEDIWAYLANVREFLNAGSLATNDPQFGGAFRGFSRMMINGWLLEQAALARVSSIDPVEMTFGYLTPALVVLSLLATYALAKTVIESETGAIITGCLLAVLFLVSLTTPIAQSLLTPGGEFINRITEDKYVARFLFVPVALALAVLALKMRRLRYLLLFAFACPSVVAVHPLGLVFIGLPVAGLGLLHLLFNLRDRGAWGSVGGLALSLLAVGGPPTLYLVATGSSLLQRMDSMAPRVATSLTEGLGYYDEIQAVGERHIVDPVFLLNPAVLAAYVLGVPFLVLRVRNSPAAQLLLGTLLLVPVLCFVPPIAGFAGDVIGPWILPRLAWPIPLAAVVVLGWLLWEGLTYVRGRLEAGGSRTEHLVGLLLAPLLVFCGLVAAAPSSIAQVETADQLGEIPEEEVSCSNPVFAWMDDGLPASSTVLAPEAENSCIMARASTADILNYRKQKPGRNEFKVILERFYDSATLNTDTIRMLRYYEVDYIMLPRDEELGEQMRHRPDSFTEVGIPDGQYVLYEVDLPNLETDALVPANDSLLSGDFETATEAYEEALEGAQGTGDEDALFLSYLGLGQSYTGQKLPDEAAPYFEQAAALAPEDEAAHLLLSRAKEAAGEEEEARAALERAVELAPGNANLRLRLAELALRSGDEEEAIGQYRMLVETFPEVPRYRALLGKALLLAGNGEAAEQQLQEATGLSPLSEEVYAEVGTALRDAGRLEAAAARYERAVELEPRNQLYNLDLGRIYSTLSTAEGRDEGYFEKAEETLIRAAGQQPVPGTTAASQQAALLALGDLYYRWDREEEAIAVYEQVLKEDPNSEAASNRLEELQS